MTIKQRVAVIKMFYGGGWLDRGGRTTVIFKNAVRLRNQDAVHYLALMRTRERSDPMYGASLEWLPKRGDYTPLTLDEYRDFLIKTKTARLEADAVKHEQIAAGYDKQAEYARGMAKLARDKAVDIRRLFGQGTTI